MKNISLPQFLILLVCMLSLASCEEEFIPPIGDEAEQYVIEGYVEAGEGTTQTFILITKSVKFFEEFNADEYATLFVDNANVSVNDGEKTVQFTKLCLSDLPDGEVKDEVGEQLGVNLDSITVDICIYIDLFDELLRESGRSYDLVVDIEGYRLTSTTTIPDRVELKEFVFREIPGEPIDSLSQMFATISDPVGKNFYRYFTEDDFGNLNTSFSSITDDVQFEGLEFEFPLAQADDLGENFDRNTYGFFNVGDTVLIKWCTIDEAHFNFWNTFEYSLNGQGSPFTAYTRISDNIEGGFGIWGGYAVQLEELIVTKE
jgi:hypothetical protein